MNNVELMRAVVNGAAACKAHQRGNSDACRVLSDALRDADDEREADLWQRVADALDEMTRDENGGLVFYATDEGEHIGIYWIGNDPRDRAGIQHCRVSKESGECSRVGVVDRRKLENRKRERFVWVPIAGDVSELAERRRQYWADHWKQITGHAAVAV